MGFVFNSSVRSVRYWDRLAVGIKLVVEDEGKDMAIGAEKKPI